MVNPSDRFTDRFEAFLNKPGDAANSANAPRYEVLNIAMPGWNTTNHFNALEWTDQLFEYNALILAYFPNDIQGIRDQPGPPKPPRLFRPIIDRSYAASFFYSRYAMFRLAQLQDFESSFQELYDDPEVWAIHKERLAKISNYCIDRNKPFLALTIPMIGVLDDYPFYSAHEKLNSFWDARGVKHADALSAFDSYSDSDVVVNPFDRHPNVLGHEIIARVLSDNASFMADE